MNKCEAKENVRNLIFRWSREICGELGGAGRSKDSEKVTDLVVQQGSGALEENFHRTALPLHRYAARGYAEFPRNLPDCFQTE